MTQKPKKGDLGQVQTPFFTWAESNANEKNPLFSLISIQFDSCEVRRLNLALRSFPSFALRILTAHNL